MRDIIIGLDPRLLRILIRSQRATIQSLVKYSPPASWQEWLNKDTSTDNTQILRNIAYWNAERICDLLIYGSPGVSVATSFRR